MTGYSAGKGTGSARTMAKQTSPNKQGDVSDLSQKELDALPTEIFNNPYGLGVGGNKKVIGNLNRDDYRAWYKSDNKGAFSGPNEHKYNKPTKPTEPTIAKQRVVTVDDSNEMKNSKNQTQSNVLNSRKKKTELNLSEGKRFNDYLAKKYPDGLSEALLAKAKAKFKAYDSADSTNRADFTASADSIDVVNTKANKKKGDEIDNF